LSGLVCATTLFVARNNNATMIVVFIFIVFYFVTKLGAKVIVLLLAT